MGASSSNPLSTGTSVGAVASGGGAALDLSISFSTGVFASAGVCSSFVPGGVAPGLSCRASWTETASSTATIWSLNGRALAERVDGSSGGSPASVEVPEKPLRQSSPPSERRNIRPLPLTHVWGTPFSARMPYSSMTNSTTESAPSGLSRA